ncbi:MAG TPA: hypothetical protein VFJ82_00540, partial [Longimicrobium sp.]|nr:hypothetical protein [Longimicrobium sp.]
GGWRSAAVISRSLAMRASSTWVQTFAPHWGQVVPSSTVMVWLHPVQVTVTAVEGVVMDSPVGVTVYANQVGRSPRGGWAAVKVRGRKRPTDVSSTSSSTAVAGVR